MSGDLLAGRSVPNPRCTARRRYDPRSVWAEPGRIDRGYFAREGLDGRIIGDQSAQLSFLRDGAEQYRLRLRQIWPGVGGADLDRQRFESQQHRGAGVMVGQALARLIDQEARLRYLL